MEETCLQCVIGYVEDPTESQEIAAAIDDLADDETPDWETIYE